MKAQVTLVTAPDRKVARKIADALVAERLAACVSVVPGLASTYRWEGKIHRDREVLLVIKSRATLAVRLQERIRQLHPYTVPEIIHLPIAGGAASYLKWLGEATSR